MLFYTVNLCKIIHMKKINKILLCYLLITISFFSYAETSRTERLSETLSGFKLAASYTNAFPLYNMDDFSKCSTGGSAGFEFALFPMFSENLDLGFYGRAAFQNFIPYSLQLEKLYSYSFGGGIFAEWFLPQDISLAASAGAGFLISEVEFVSAEKDSIDDVYYDFMLEGDLSVRKNFIKFPRANVLLSAGCHFAFYNEKSESFCTLGPSFGVLLNFKQNKGAVSGVNR